MRACGPWGETAARQYGIVMKGPVPNIFIVFNPIAWKTVIFASSGRSSREVAFSFSIFAPDSEEFGTTGISTATA